MPETRLLGKTLKELRALAKEHKIKGRSRMSGDELQRELWKIFYGEDYIPKNSYDSLDFLMLHPSKIVRDIFHMWGCYGGKTIAEGLEIVSRCHATTIAEDAKDRPRFTASQAFEDMIKSSTSVIYNHVSLLMEDLKAIDNLYYAQRTLEEWKGEVLYLVREQGYMHSEYNPYKIFFYSSGKTCPANTAGWILLHPEQKDLAQKTIKEKWEYDENLECYWISASEISALKEYLDVVKTSGEI